MDYYPPVPVPPVNKGQFVGAKDRECVHPNWGVVVHQDSTLKAAAYCIKTMKT